VRGSGTGAGFGGGAGACCAALWVELCADVCAREPRGEVARAPSAAVPRKERRVNGAGLVIGDSGWDWGRCRLGYRGWVCEFTICWRDGEMAEVRMGASGHRGCDGEWRRCCVLPADQRSRVERGDTSSSA
jgi:hypothetical protein